ncbi:MAG: hypothetical protein H6873_05105 [Hyphomicrobiaceae bacterium]|nr:hypothetical protein [Hyphomicrobiaceae bacterium]
MRGCLRRCRGLFGGARCQATPTKTSGAKRGFVSFFAEAPEKKSPFCFKRLQLRPAIEFAAKNLQIWRGEFWCHFDFNVGCTGAAMTEAGSIGSFFSGLSSEAMREAPPPPWQVEVENYLVVGVKFDGTAVRRHLPRGLVPIDDCSGIFAMYHAPRGWAVTPYTSFYLAIAVRNFNSSDGSVAHYIVRHTDDERAFRAFAKYYGPGFRLGHTDIAIDGDRISARAFEGDGLIAEMELNSPPDPNAPITSGIHNYLMDSWDGDVQMLKVAFTGQYPAASPEACRLVDSDHFGLSGLQPTEITWALFAPRMSLVVGPFEPLPEGASQPADSGTRLALMELLSRIGLAAALVTRDGKILFVNNLARGLMEAIEIGGRLLVWRREDQARLDAALELVSEGRDHLSEPIAIERPETSLPMLVHALPVSAALAGEAAILVLFRDPEALPGVDIPSLLQLLGLTPAEARLASAVGSGRSVGDSANLLQISENTARSTLKAIYGKLGISKQSELAKIVARLDL